MTNPRSLETVLHYPDAISQVSADGGDVYWLAAIAAEDGRITVRRLRDGEVTDLTPEASVRSRAMEYGGGAYSVDAGVLAWCDDRTRQVWVADDSGRRPLTPEQARFIYGGLVLSVADGVLLAVREDHDAAPEPRTEIVALSLTGDNADGGRVIATGADFYAGIAVQAGRLAWFQWNHPQMSWDEASVWTATLADPTDAAPVVAKPEVAANGSVWLPDGRLAYVSDESGFWNWRLAGGHSWAIDHDAAGPLWVLDRVVATAVGGTSLASVVYRDGRGAVEVWNWATGAITRPLPGTSDIDSLAWADGVLYAVAQWPDRAATLVAIDTSGAVTTLAGPAEGDPEAVAPEAVWTSTDAGPIHSWLYRPAAENPPLLVMTHGGPTSMATSSYDETRQFWVSRGFAVLDVNYGGSTGFGRAYRNRLRGVWGILDVTDVAAAVRDVTGRGLADPARVSITGGSAGGFTTLGSLVGTDLYAAGISRYGIGDLTTLATDTHKAESRYCDGLVAPWPEGRDVYVERSPIQHLDTLTTPMLILQGTEDKVVPPAQAVQMADAVRAAGRPVALVMLEGEGHGFRAWATRRTALEAQVSFLEQVLGLPHSDDVPLLAIENLPTPVVEVEPVAEPDPETGPVAD